MEAITFTEAIPDGCASTAAVSPITDHHRSASMILITIDLVPGGFQPMRRTIGSMRIANVSDLADISDYAVDVLEAANKLAGTNPRSGSCRVEGHDRRQSIWALIAKSAEAAMHAEYDEL
jgi:hypothetical protein